MLLIEIDLSSSVVGDQNLIVVEREVVLRRRDLSGSVGWGLESDLLCRDASFPVMLPLPTIIEFYPLGHT